MNTKDAWLSEGAGVSGLKTILTSKTPRTAHLKHTPNRIQMQPDSQNRDESGVITLNEVF